MKNLLIAQTSAIILAMGGIGNRIQIKVKSMRKLNLLRFAFKIVGR